MGVIDKAIDYAVEVARDDSHGYDQINRWGPDFDCSSLVIEAFAQAGTSVKANGATYTGNMRRAFLASGFIDVTGQVTLSSGAGLQRGDVLLNEGKHTELYIGNGQDVAASINEKGTIKGGKTGDQTGREILIRNYKNFPWDCVLRYPEQTEAKEPENAEGASYKVVAGDTLIKIANKYGVSVQAIVNANKLKNADLIIIGQVLRIPAPSTPSDVWTGKVITQTDPLNIRTKANGKIIGQLPKGSTIRIKGEAVDGWLKLADRDGYVSAKYVQRV